MIGIYIFIFLLCILLISIAIYRIKHPFSTRLMVFHPYSIMLWMKEPHIIEPNDWSTKHFYNPLYVSVDEISEDTDFSLLANKIGRHFNTQDIHAEYSVDIDALQHVHAFHEYKAFMCMYTLHNKCISIMTFRPLYLYIHNKSYIIQYADFLSTDPTYRKQSVTTTLYYTAAHTIRKRMKQLYGNHVCDIFMSKKEGRPLPIVPIVAYTSIVYDMNALPIVHTKLKIGQIDAFTLLQDKRLYSSFHILSHLSASNLNHLIKKNIMHVFKIDWFGYFIFRDAHFEYQGKSVIECIGSVLFDVNYMSVFQNAFLCILRQFFTMYGIVIVEHISHNVYISLNTIPEYVFPCTYYLYNYSQKTIQPKDVLCII